jgi:predicted nuclease with TOPRIM domain
MRNTLEDLVNNNQNIIDTRDLIARIEELEGEIAELEEERDELDEDEDGAERLDEIQDELKYKNAELEVLKDFAFDAEYSPDFEYGETLIRDSYFTEYAQQFAEDIDVIPKNASWPLQFIDWEAAADALKQDYRRCDFDGVEYWVRS